MSYKHRSNRRASERARKAARKNRRCHDFHDNAGMLSHARDRGLTDFLVKYLPRRQRKAPCTGPKAMMNRFRDTCMNYVEQHEDHLHCFIRWNPDAKVILGLK